MHPRSSVAWVLSECDWYVGQILCFASGSWVATCNPESLTWVANVCRERTPCPSVIPGEKKPKTVSSVTKSGRALYAHGGKCGRPLEHQRERLGRIIVTLEGNLTIPPSARQMRNAFRSIRKIAFSFFCRYCSDMIDQIHQATRPSPVSDPGRMLALPRPFDVQIAPTATGLPVRARPPHWGSPPPSPPGMAPGPRWSGIA